MANENSLPLVKGLSCLVAFLLFLLMAGTVCAQNPVPFINEPLVPDAAEPGGAAFTLTVNGTEFVTGAVVKWNGSARVTVFVSESQLQAAILASDVAKPGTASVTVVNPGPGGGVSNTAFLPVAQQAALVFTESSFSTSAGAGSVATADFNKDGKLDLLIANPGSGEVSVALGNGDGTFQSPVSYLMGLGGSPSNFAVGDLNGDGSLDFVVSDSGNNLVTVFIGNGDGTFKPGLNYPAGTGPTSVAIADLNGDGKLDLAVTNQNCNPTCGPGTVSILLGIGNGMFQTQVQFPAGSSPNSVTVGDFNRDGKLDLAVANVSTASVLINNGGGSFLTPVSYPLNPSGSSVSIGTADFDGDGKLDLAVVDTYGVVSILLGVGDGTFLGRVDYLYTTGVPSGRGLSIGDFNGDGHLDLATADKNVPWVFVLQGNGDGTFQSPIQISISSSGFVPGGLAAGDFNGDGRLDLAVPYLNVNSGSILLQDGTVGVSPSILNFGVNVVGTSNTKTVTLTNAGASSLVISSIAITGSNASDFVQSNTCGSSLGAGANCTISVTFQPSQLGPASASLTIADNAPGSPQSVALGGTGVISGANATLSTTSLTFATQLVGTTSAAQSIILSNYGTNTLNVVLSIAGGDPTDFAQANNCGISVAPGASCTINVTFKPTGINQRTASLSITDNGPGSPQIISLTGASTEVELNPASLLFLGLPGQSVSRSITLTNVGSTKLAISSISSSTGGVGTNCPMSPKSLAAGASCTITLTLHFTYRGEAIRGQVSVFDNGGGSPQVVNFIGEGCSNIACH